MVLWRFYAVFHPQLDLNHATVTCPGLESAPETIETTEVVRISLAMLECWMTGKTLWKNSNFKIGGNASHRCFFWFLPTGDSIDFWSHEPVLQWQFLGLGCVLLTLYTGERPFPVQSSLQHLVVMQRVIGTLTCVPQKNRTGISCWIYCWYPYILNMLHDVTCLYSC